MKRSLIGNAFNVLSTIILQLTIANVLGTSKEASYLFYSITLATVVVSISSSLVQSLYFPLLMRNKLINLPVLKSVLRFTLFSLSIYFLINLAVYTYGGYFDNYFIPSNLFLLIATFGSFQLISTLLVGLSYLQGNRLGPALSPAIPSITAIIQLKSEPSLKEVFSSLIIGSLLQVVFLCFTIKKMRFEFDVRPKTWSILNFSLTSISYSALSFTTLYQRHVLGNTSDSAIAIYSYAEKSALTQQSALAFGLNQSAFGEWNSNDHKTKDESLDSVSRHFKATCFIVGIFGLFCISFSQELIMIVFERGAFRSESTVLVAETFLLLQYFVYFSSLSSLWSNLYFSRIKSNVVIYTSLLGSMLICGYVYFLNFPSPHLIALGVSGVTTFVLFLRLIYSERTSVLNERKFWRMVLFVSFSQFIFMSICTFASYNFAFYFRVGTFLVVCLLLLRVSKVFTSSKL